MKIIKHILLSVILFHNVFALWEWNYIIRVNPNGKASVKIKDKVINVDPTIELLWSWANLVGDYSLVEYQQRRLYQWKEYLYKPQGYIPIKEGKNFYELILYDDLSTIFIDDSITNKNTNIFQIDNVLKGFEVNIENFLFKKTITVYYSFKKRQYDNQIYENYIKKASPKINIIITLPGDLIETTGIIAAENTSKWTFKLYDVQQTEGRIYMKSEINSSPINQLFSEKRAKSKIIKYYEEIDGINFEIVKLKEMTKYQRKINNEIKTKKNESDMVLIKSLNTLVTIYHQDTGKYPTGLDDIKEFSKKHFDDVPTPFNGEIIYNVRNRSFKIIK